MFVCQKPEKKQYLNARDDSKKKKEKLISFHSNGVERLLFGSCRERLRYDLRLFPSSRTQKSNFSSTLPICAHLEAQASLLSPRQTNNRLTRCQYFDLSITGK